MAAANWCIGNTIKSCCSFMLCLLSCHAALPLSRPPSSFQSLVGRGKSPELSDGWQQERWKRSNTNRGDRQLDKLDVRQVQRREAVTVVTLSNVQQDIRCKWADFSSVFKSTKRHKNRRATYVWATCLSSTESSGISCISCKHGGKNAFGCIITEQVMKSYV